LFTGTTISAIISIEHIPKRSKSESCLASPAAQVCKLQAIVTLYHACVFSDAICLQTDESDVVFHDYCIS
jgi:hypothetical protein